MHCGEFGGGGFLFAFVEVDVIEGFCGIFAGNPLTTEEPLQIGPDASMTAAGNADCTLLGEE